jgi:hypothetical protein
MQQLYSPTQRSGDEDLVDFVAGAEQSQRVSLRPAGLALARPQELKRSADPSGSGTS